MGIAAGVVFGSSSLPAHQAALVCLIYVLVGASTIIVPVLGYLLAEQRVRPWLDEMRVWLTQYNTTVLGVMLLVIGAVMRQ